MSKPCDHEYKEGIAMQNVATNGQTTDSSEWSRGDGIYASTKARLVPVLKCIKCGASCQ